MKHVVIADDISGAAELAGIAYLHGLKAEVQLDGFHRCDSDVIVVDANSRSLEPADASDAMARVGADVKQWLGSDRFTEQWVYRKVDSVLRGPLARELKTFMQTFEAERTVLVNANPRKGRIVEAGCLLVDGRPIHETQFAKDPEYPRTSMRVAELLDWPADDLHFFSGSQMLAESGLCVGNVTSSQAMLGVVEIVKQSMLASGHMQIADNLPRFNHKTLLAGAAEFYEAILAQWFGLRSRPEPRQRLLAGNDVLLVSGTMIPAELPVKLPAEISSRKFQLIRACDLELEIDDGIDRDRARRVHEELIERTASALTAGSREQVWIEGGRTASTLLRRMGWTRLEVEAVYADGVVGLRSGERDSPHVVVKPGSYAWGS